MHFIYVFSNQTYPINVSTNANQKTHKISIHIKKGR
jgi:hypothetical protein